MVIQTQPQLHNPSSGGGLWMWNPSHHQHQEVTQPLNQPHQGYEDNESWEVRAFAEDTGGAMGTTWPPRSYTCTFCKREFRSAQALGGHMNVHRRDRALLHHGTAPSSSSALIIPAQEFMASAAGAGGLCLLYQLPPDHSVGISAMAAPPRFNHRRHRPTYHKSSESDSWSIDYSKSRKGSSSSSSSSPSKIMEELDLELRL